MVAIQDPGGSKDRLTTVWAGIVRSSKDGLEGVPAVGSHSGFVFPLYYSGGWGSDKDAENMMRDLAQRVSDQMGIEITVAKFTVREDLFTIKPSTGTDVDK